jgi:hypothetical protein
LFRCTDKKKKKLTASPRRDRGERDAAALNMPGGSPLVRRFRRNMMTRTHIAIPMMATSLAIALFASGAPVQASSPTAWAALDRKVAEACIKASGLKTAHVSRPVQFDDTLGKVVTLVSGIYPQKHMKGAKGHMLCVFDKASGRTWINEAEGWTAPDLR